MEQSAVGEASTAVSSWLPMDHGQALFVRDWPVADARGAVLFVHGLGEHGGRYERLAAWFNARGYAVRCHDQRGHGRTPGQRGALRHPDDLLTDLGVVYRDFAAHAPVAPLLLGHSMGGLVALRSVLDGRIVPPGLILSSPALRTRESRAMQRLAGLLAHWLPNLPLRSRLSFDGLSHDRQVIADAQRDRFRQGWITPRLAHFIFGGGAACVRDAATLAVPTLLLIAGADALVDPYGARDFARGAAGTGQLTTRIFDPLYHELFNEAEPARGQVLLQVRGWLARLPAG